MVARHNSRGLRDAPGDADIAGNKSRRHARPLFEEHGVTSFNSLAFPGTDDMTAGLTTREYFAIRCLQGILASGPEGGPFEKADDAMRRLARSSVRIADMLIEALNEVKPKEGGG